MAKSIPDFPISADHRIMKRFLEVFGIYGKIKHVDEEFDRVSDKFLEAGGSWKGVFDGSSDDVGLLKDVLRVAYKHGAFTKR